MFCPPIGYCGVQFTACERLTRLCMCFIRFSSLFEQHTERTFYNADGTVKHADSQVFLNSFDFLGIDVIANEVPMLKKAMVAECEGVYCGQPFYIPVKHLIKYVFSCLLEMLQIMEL